MTFNIPTAMQLTATMTLFIGIALAFCVQGYPPALQRPIRLWVRGLLLQSGAYLLLAFRGVAPDLLTVVMANGLLALGLMLHMQALRELNQRPPRGSHFAVLLLVLLIGELLLTYVWPDPLRRVMLSSVMLTITAAYGVVAIHHKRGSLTRAERMLVGVLAIGMAILLLRVAFPGETGLDTMRQSSMLAGVVFTYAALLPVIATTGFVLMLGERLNEDLVRLATIDPLTGACNRRTLSALANHALASARRQRQPLALLLLDVDHFKSINDEFGHEAGDAALCTLVHLLTTHLRGQDVVSRIGGEEFAIMLPECNEAA
ncbi:MAG: GGDEF domain-containing protein, partial [Dokdonella sp.]